MKHSGKINRIVFGIAAISYAVIFLFVILIPQRTSAVLHSLLNFTLSSVGWLYILSSCGIVLIFWGIGISRHGKMKLGKAEDKPEHSFFSWMGMLFCAGIGGGLIFFGVYEPVSHYMIAPFSANMSEQAIPEAFRTVFLHWGVSWAIHGFVGLAIGYFVYKRGLPNMISSTFYPLLGEKAVNGKIGSVINALALMMVICGVSMTIGIATTQFLGGLHMNYNVPNTFINLVVVIAIAGIVATLSCMRGLKKGIRVVSDITVYGMLLLLLFGIVCGSVPFLISTFIQGLGNLAGNLPWLLLFTDANHEIANKVGFDWMRSWTIWYWAWYYSFAPFVGAFLAKISKGRTIREYVFATSFVPGSLCCLWCVCFGGDAIRQMLTKGSEIGARIIEDTDASFFVYLDTLPWTAVTVPFTLILLLLLCITTINSSTYIAGTFSIGGVGEPSVLNRAIWGIFITVNSAVFLWLGGLPLLKDINILLAFPFIFIIVLMAISFLKELRSLAPTQSSK